MLSILNRNISIHITTLLTLLLLSLSCSQKSELSHERGSLSVFTTMEQDTVKSLFSSYEKPDCHLKMNFEVPVEGSSVKVVNAATMMIVSLAEGDVDEYSSSIKEMINQYTRTYIFNYLEEGNDALRNFGEDIEKGATWMTFEECCEGRVLYNDNGIFSYSVKKYSYTGGAHGISTNRVASLDLDNKKVITLQSLFDSERLESVRQEVLAKLNENYQLLTDEVELTDNFYLTNDKVVFVYDPMTLAAYSEGEITIEIDR